MFASSTHTTHRARWSLRLCVLLGGILHPAVAWAQGNPFGSSIIDTIAMISTLIITALHLLTWVVFFYLNILLSPTFIFDLDATTAQPGAFMGMLNEIWQFSRDLVNIVFAFALIGVAVVTIVMAKKDYIVEHWRKFVLAIILVNFSWLFPRLILDASNVVAAAVYGVPTMIASNTQCRTVSVGSIADANCQPNTLGNNIYDCDCFYINNLKLFIEAPEYNAINGNDGWHCPLASGVLCYQRKVMGSGSIAAHASILNGLVVNHARLQALASVPPARGGNTSISFILQFLMRELLVLVFHILLLFPLLALFVAFLIRIPVLWLTIAGMPFYFLGWVIPEKLTGGYTEKIMQLFLKAAFLPAIVGIPLSVGFIMVNAGTKIQHNTLDTVMMNILPGISSMWQILWMLISMGVVWVGVFAVLQKMDIMGKGSEAIKSFGQTLGGIALKLPLAAPIIPGIGGKSLLALPQMAAGVNAQLSQGARWDDLKIGNAMQTGAIDTAAQKLAKDPQNTAALNDLSDKLSDVTRRIGTGPGGLDRNAAANEINGYLRQHNLGFTVDANNMEGNLRDLVSRINHHDGTIQTQGLTSSINNLAGKLQPTTPPAPPAGTTPPAGNTTP